MAPSKTTKRAASQSQADIDNSDTASADASQDGELQKKVTLCMNKHIRRLKDTRAKRRQAILAAHDKRREQLKADVEQCLREHDARVRATRRRKVERFIHLVGRKRELESKIHSCQADLEHAFFSTAQQLTVTFQGRVGDLGG